MSFFSFSFGKWNKQIVIHFSEVNLKELKNTPVKCIANILKVQSSKAIYRDNALWKFLRRNLT